MKVCAFDRVGPSFKDYGEDTDGKTHIVRHFRMRFQQKCRNRGNLFRWTGLCQGLNHHFRYRPDGGRSEEHTSELQSLMRISYAVFCLKKKKKNRKITHLH